MFSANWTVDQLLEPDIMLPSQHFGSRTKHLVLHWRDRERSTANDSPFSRAPGYASKWESLEVSARRIREAA